MKNKLTSAALNLEGLFVAILIGGLSFLSSCKKDDNALPTVKSNKALAASNSISARGADAEIFIQHSAGEDGQGPAYSLAAMDDGTVYYNGERNVATLGEVKLFVGKQNVEDLRMFALEMGFEAIVDQLPGDERMASTLTQIRTNDERFKSVLDFGREVPEALELIKSTIEDKLGITDLIRQTAGGGDAKLALIIKHGADRDGNGKVYTIYAFEDGVVLYNGTQEVKKLGEVRLEVGMDLITDITNTASEMGFSDLKDEYPGQEEGLAGSYTEIHFQQGSVPKSVQEFGVDVPDQLKEIQRMIEDKLGIRDLVGE